MEVRAPRPSCSPRVRATSLGAERPKALLPIGERPMLAVAAAGAAASPKIGAHRRRGASGLRGRGAVVRRGAARPHDDPDRWADAAGVGAGGADGPRGRRRDRRRPRRGPALRAAGPVHGRDRAVEAGADGAVPRDRRGGHGQAARRGARRRYRRSRTSWGWRRRRRPSGSGRSAKHTTGRSPPRRR